MSTMLEVTNINWTKDMLENHCQMYNVTATRFCKHVNNRLFRQKVLPNIFDLYDTHLSNAMYAGNVNLSLYLIESLCDKFEDELERVYFQSGVCHRESSDLRECVILICLGLQGC